MTRWEEFVLKIWRSRDHECECCGGLLLFPIRTYYFSHLLSRGAYPELKWNEINVMLMCLPCHKEWENGDRTLKMFDRANELVEQLKNDIQNRTPKSL